MQPQPKEQKREVALRVSEIQENIMIDTISVVMGKDSKLFRHACRKNAKEVVDALLKKHGILVRAFTVPGKT